jgi:sugar (pentulose or hexulose) kinase
MVREAFGMDLRGIAVIDAGSTNTKVALFDAAGSFVTSRSVASTHHEGPPYRHIDPAPLAVWLPGALGELDAILPVDRIVPCAHGSAFALVDGDGRLVFPIMDYTAEPPANLRSDYETLAPPYSEVFCVTLPMALSVGLQFFWQERIDPARFAAVRTIIPWAQYLAYLLTGKALSEVSSIGAQTQIWDPRRNVFSSIARERGWDRLFAPMARAWDGAGLIAPAMRPENFRGRGEVLAGIHDSDATFLRYLCAGVTDFTLVSSGTWLIGFDTGAELERLDTARDLASGSDIFGRALASFRFMGGRELEIIAGTGAPQADMTTIAELVSKHSFAIPSFTDSGGPMPGTGGRGRISGPQPSSAHERSALAALYCALMTDQSLEAVGSRGQIIVDGPFGTNAAFMAVLAALREGQDVLASDLRDGTTAGAALLALMGADGALPAIGLKLDRIARQPLPGLAEYRREWLALSEENRNET